MNLSGWPPLRTSSEKTERIGRQMRGDMHGADVRRDATTTLDPRPYLERIQCAGMMKREILEPSLRLLRTLHEAHLLAVPFENLSIHYGQPIFLEDQALYDKIVRRRRGGFCYELN